MFDNLMLIKLHSFIKILIQATVCGKYIANLAIGTSISYQLIEFFTSRIHVLTAIVRTLNFVAIRMICFSHEIQHHSTLLK